MSLDRQPPSHTPTHQLHTKSRTTSSVNSSSGLRKLSAMRAGRLARGLTLPPLLSGLSAGAGGGGPGPKGAMKRAGSHALSGAAAAALEASLSGSESNSLTHGDKSSVTEVSTTSTPFSGPAFQSSSKSGTRTAALGNSDVEEAAAAVVLRLGVVEGEAGGMVSVRACVRARGVAAVDGCEKERRRASRVPFTSPTSFSRASAFITSQEQQQAMQALQQLDYRILGRQKSCNCSRLTPASGGGTPRRAGERNQRGFQLVSEGAIEWAELERGGVIECPSSSDSGAG